MKNMMNLMRQAKDMQNNMKAAQQKLAQTAVTGEAAGGAVTVTMMADLTPTAVAINPEFMADADASMLEDVVLTALKEAAQNAKKTAESEMKAATGGMNLPF